MGGVTEYKIPLKFPPVPAAWLKKCYAARQTYFEDFYNIIRLVVKFAPNDGDFVDARVSPDLFNRPQGVQWGLINAIREFACGDIDIEDFAEVYEEFAVDFALGSL